jgi:hypothetical protein
MLVALLALFISLGGSAYAALSLPRNSVGTAQLQKSAVTTPKLHKGAVITAKLRNNSVTDAKLSHPSLTISAGKGLTGGGTGRLGSSIQLAVNPAVVQNRVTGTCAKGISSINQDGTVSCASQ